MDDRELEHRLTKLEGTVAFGIQGIHERLDKMNGRVEEHDDWIAGQRQQAAHIAGAQEERFRLRAGDKATLAAMFGVFQMIAVAVGVLAF